MQYPIILTVLSPPGGHMIGTISQNPSPEFYSDSAQSLLQACFSFALRELDPIKSPFSHWSCCMLDTQQTYQHTGNVMRGLLLTACSSRTHTSTRPCSLGPPPHSAPATGLFPISSSFCLEGSSPSFPTAASCPSFVFQFDHTLRDIPDPLV